MHLYELAVDNYKNTKMNCAESVLDACNRYYNLNLTDREKALISPLGEGMQTFESCCGAISASVSIIGLITLKDQELNFQNKEGEEYIQELIGAFLNSFSTLQCRSLQQLQLIDKEEHEVEDNCPVFVEVVTRKLEEIINQIRQAQN
ncbi:MAG: C-GCAxxG-C-C family protein [Thomasclavelia sp.]|nr:C-GCAxxG-C-C family protein [Thomasclavelia sp.]